MLDHDKVEVFGVYNEIKVAIIYESSSNIVKDVESKLPLITSKYPLERALIEHDIFGMEMLMRWFRF